MGASGFRVYQAGFYWSLLFVSFVCFTGTAEAHRKTKPKPQAIEHDTAAELERISREAEALRQQLKIRPKYDPILQRLAELAIRAALGAERSLAVGDAPLFDTYRRKIREKFHSQRWRIDRMAAQGSGRARFALGVFAVHGMLEPANVELACQHFSGALAKNFRAAGFRLSQCLARDDPERAAGLMREAADSGHPVAGELLARDCLEAKPADTACAYERLTVAAEAGRPSAQSLLAWMYTQGVGGRSNTESAARLYLLAARAGDAAAQNNVGELYETGRGVAADPKQALDWYRKAAEAGFAPAQFNLGRMYAAGHGMAKNLPEGRKWLESADKAGIAQARQVLEWIDREAVGLK